MGNYLIAVKRRMQGQITLEQAHAKIRDIPGVEFLSPIGPYTISFSADDRALAEIVRRISKWCHIETSISHYPQTVA